MRLKSPISVVKIKLKGASSPALARIHTSQSQIYEALLRTCHQIRDEGKQVFYKINSWSLHPARLRETPSEDPLAAMCIDS